MSDRMRGIPFLQLLNWVHTEYEREQTVFGCAKMYQAHPEHAVSFDNRKLETLVGPAAGPHTQLAQNIIAAYFCGARVFELKTVQTLDGEDLHVSKPCILAEDEGYNCEWSTELTVQQAFEEYVKAWFVLHYLAAELQLGAADGFVFNMSVGYDLEGIKSRKIDDFIEGLKNAEHTEIFQTCKRELLEFLPQCARMTERDVNAVSPKICSSITLSTMHGCPAGEIEKIASYLIEEKHLNLYLKCNPTLLGYDYVRRVLDEREFTYIQFEKEQFEGDLKYEDAVPMLKRLKEKAEALGQCFGVKLTNTFPVKKLRGELPDDTMYMSGRTLLPLSLEVAARLSREFEGKLPISYCGGADAGNIDQIVSTGIWPVTVCTDLLKPGGYGKLKAMAEKLEEVSKNLRKETDSEAIHLLGQTLCKNAGKGKTVRRGQRPQDPAAQLNCKKVCGNCASLCPNRANVVISVHEEKQMLHIDGMCNECGNCASFCPEKCTPYLEKLTVFSGEKEFYDSKNYGFYEENGCFTVRWEGQILKNIPADSAQLPEKLSEIIKTVKEEYSYLLY